MNCYDIAYFVVTSDDLTSSPLSNGTKMADLKSSFSYKIKLKNVNGDVIMLFETMKKRTIF